ALTEEVMKATTSDQRSVLDIQSFDFITTSLNAKAATLPEIAAIASLKIKANNARDLRIAAETELSDVKRELNRAETDVEQVVSRITRDETRLASGTGAAKELEQLQHELISLNNRRSELEEVELEIMMRVDGIKERIKSLQEEEASLALEIANLEIAKENALTVIGADLSAAAQERAKTVSSVSPELMALYEKIRASNNGTGAAALVGNQCKGCHLTLNTNELQRIAALAEDELVRCEECRCILVRDK
ncbi:MAG: C4-type zinc ribbon domain-containing protein, partial [Actinomycetota bacterium]|nr:C4-type zinc ribbon domain-containing protein [Actinomycetota bacterium]